MPDSCPGAMVLEADFTFQYEDAQPIEISLSVGRGEFVAVVGRSGFGKTTMLRVLAGLLNPTAGAVRQADEQNGSVALVPQDYLLLPWLDAVRNVEVALLGSNLDKKSRLERSRRAMQSVGGGEFGDGAVSFLSGGMQQRVALARALVVEPKVLLLDEPFSAVDWFTRRSLQQLVLTLQRDSGLSVVLVTHDLDEAIRLADRVHVLSGSPRCLQAAEMIDVPQMDRAEREHARQLADIKSRLLQHMEALT